MSNPTDIPPGVSLAPIAAPVLLGYLLNWGLFGTLTVQVYWYYIAFPNDKWRQKWLVYGIYLIEVAQTILISHDAFTAYAKFFGDVDKLDAMQNEWLTVPVMSSIVSCSVQVYYAYRLYILSSSWLLTGFVCTIALMQATAGIVAGVQAFRTGTFTGLAQKAVTSEAIWLAGSAACDIIIAASMASLLLRKTTNVTAETRAMVTKLVRAVVETGALTALAATVDIGLYFGYPHNNFHACVALVLAKLYSNSLLVLLNSRAQIVDGRNWRPADVMRFAQDNKRASTGHQLPVVFSPEDATSSLGVQVHEEVWTDSGNVPMQQRVSDVAKKARNLEDVI